MTTVTVIFEEFFIKKGTCSVYLAEILSVDLSLDSSAVECQCCRNIFPKFGVPGIIIILTKHITRLAVSHVHLM